MESKVPITERVLAWGGVGMFGIILILMFYREIPEKNVSTLNLAIGGLMGWVGATYAFYFGDSKKSQVQQDTISTLSSTAATIAGTGNGTTPTAQVLPQGTDSSIPPKEQRI